MKHWISLSVFLACMGCAQPSRILRVDGPQMTDLMNSETRSSASVTDGYAAARYTPSEQAGDESLYAEIVSDKQAAAFAVLPNPTITLYIYPHLSTRHRAPVPGYRTVIKLYERDEFAVHGEFQMIGEDERAQ